MEIKRNGSQACSKGPADYFTGAVRVDSLFQTPDPARVSSASVTFEPGARTAWHRYVRLRMGAARRRLRRGNLSRRRDPVSAW
jgi:hypothetical protein